MMNQQYATSTGGTYKRSYISRVRIFSSEIFHPPMCYQIMLLRLPYAKLILEVGKKLRLSNFYHLGIGNCDIWSVMNFSVYFELNLYE